MLRIEELGKKNLKIYQDDEFFCFGIDSVLLADFVEAKSKDNILDIGSGNAIIPLLLYARDKGRHIYAVEIQKELASLANENIILNELSDNITIINEDINKYRPKFEFDVIVTNPPYMKVESGLKSPNKNKAIARTEICCTLEDIFVCAKRLLKNNGALYMVHKAERIIDICEFSRKYGIELKNLRFVKSRIDTKPELCLLKFVKGAKNYLNLYNDLIIYNEDGSYTEEIVEIYK